MSGFRLNTFVIHLTGWLLFLLLPLLFLNSGHEASNAWVLFSSPFYWLFCLTYLLLFYFSLLYLVPFLFLKGKYIFYSLITLLLLGGVYFLQPFDKLLGHNPRFQAQVTAQSKADSIAALQKALTGRRPGPDTAAMPFGPLPNQDLRMQEPVKRFSATNPLWQHSSQTDAVSLVLFGIITALALSVKAIEQWHTTEQRMIKAESEKVSAELSFLKAQINPHFLFNTLNNIYMLSVMNSENTSESIMKLSNIMRYVTDDVMQDFVPLSNELKCISDYIDLQKLRLGKQTTLDFKISGEVKNQLVAPLIMMSFIENTFKYGISKKEKSIISIHISVEEGKVAFVTENSIFTGRVAERSGIGIANTKQRLQLLYPEKHSLVITDTGGKFRVNLTLNI
jgi:two-component system LytT family sensor kinase